VFEERAMIPRLHALINREPPAPCAALFRTDPEHKKIGAASLRPLHTIPVILDGAALRVSQDAESPDVSDRLPSEGS